MSEGGMPIFTDRASICAAYLKANPTERICGCHFNNSNSGPFAWIGLTTGCRDGMEIEIGDDTERFNYYGIPIGIIRWREKDATVR